MILGRKLILFAILTAIAAYFFKPQNNPQIISNDKTKKIKENPTYILYDNGNPNSQILLLVENILNRLGLHKIEVQSRGLRPENISMDWDLFWCWEHQSNFKLNWTQLKYHQKVNHWPENYVLASKSLLATETDSKYIPKAFLTAQNVREYAKKHPEKKFVMKLKSNRGIKVVDPKDMNFTVTYSIENYFAQEFIANPLLWNGTKFDFSTYVVITSINPLRLYYYEKNFILRFCKKPYNISDPEDVTSYVVSNQQDENEHFGPIKKFLDGDAYTYREAFDDFIRKKGANLDKIWKKVEDLIRSIVLSKEKDLINSVSKNPGVQG